MSALKLRDGFYWTGIIDDKLRVFDIIMYKEMCNEKPEIKRRILLDRYGG